MLLKYYEYFMGNLYIMPIPHQGNTIIEKKKQQMHCEVYFVNSPTPADNRPPVYRSVLDCLCSELLTPVSQVIVFLIYFPWRKLDFTQYRRIFNVYFLREIGVSSFLYG